MFTLRVPGKLMLMGEYAILEPGSSALILAIDRYVYITIEAADHYAVASELWNHQKRFFDYRNSCVIWESDPLETKPFLQSALQHTLNYLEQSKLLCSPFHILIHSELNEGVNKLGLGSSAAITVGVVAAILHFKGTNITSQENKIRIFKLAALAHWTAQQGGSGADIAACTFGGMVHYTSFQPNWEMLDIKEVVDKAVWPYLSLDFLSWPPTFHLAIGWTQESAHTSAYLLAFSHIREQFPYFYQQFVFTSNQLVFKAIQAIRVGHFDNLAAHLQKAQSLLRELSPYFSMPLETPLLKALSEITKKYGGSAKLSGTGGGDCGLAIIQGEELKEKLEKAWAINQIWPLLNGVSATGVEKYELV